MQKTLIRFGLVAGVLFLAKAVFGAGGSGGFAWLRAKVASIWSLSSVQADSLSAIVAAFARFGDGDARKLAYIIGTAWHESRLQPIREIKAAEGTAVWEIQKKYWATGYYGRGFVQITWRNNYEKMGNRLGLDLVRDPDLALRPEIAAKIIVVGMLEGMFTGRRLADYINAAEADFYTARRTVGAFLVNGTDTAALIESHTTKILG